MARALPMGGQACVFYGAAEFSRDIDVVVLAEALDAENSLPTLDRRDLASFAVAARLGMPVWRRGLRGLRLIL